MPPFFLLYFAILSALIICQKNSRESDKIQAKLLPACDLPEKTQKNLSISDKAEARGA